MAYFFDENEEFEFKWVRGRLYLYVIHHGHKHHGYDPHVHILDLSALSLGESDVEKDTNKYCGMAKESDDWAPYYG